MGCIPSKALLDVSHKFDELEDIADLGIDVAGANIDLSRVLSHKDQVVSKLTSGINQLFAGNGVDSYLGTGSLDENNNVEVLSPEGNKEVLDADTVILAPGSVPITLSSAPVDGEFIVDSTGALEFSEAPKKLGVIGAGIIGLELGSVWNRFGSEVVILEALDEFLPATDRRIARDAMRCFKKQGLEIQLGSRVVSSEVKRNKVHVNYLIGEDEHKLVCDKLIVAVGRQPNTDDLLHATSAVQLDERGFLFVDDVCQTDVANIYAVGDAVRGPMLAHKGMDEGVMVAERIAGQKPSVNYDCIPGVIYTHPEIAWVGETEEQLKEKGEDVKVGSFSFNANGRALAAGYAEGLVRVIADAGNDSVLGMHILGPQASELISNGVVAMEMGASSEDLALMTWAHPSLSEAVHEAALGVGGHAIHTINRRRKT